MGQETTETLIRPNVSNESVRFLFSKINESPVAHRIMVSSVHFHSVVSGSGLDLSR